MTDTTRQAPTCSCTCAVPSQYSMCSLGTPLLPGDRLFYVPECGLRVVQAPTHTYTDPEGTTMTDTTRQAPTCSCTCAMRAPTHLPCVRTAHTYPYVEGLRRESTYTTTPAARVWALVAKVYASRTPTHMSHMCD